MSAPGVPNRHILLVEDDRDLAAFMREVLVGDGFEVTLAGNGNAGLEALERWPYALVVSAHYNVEKLAGSVGAEGYLAKPFTGEDLTAAVHQVLAAESSRPA